jgi:dethiobiotin synthetase
MAKHLFVTGIGTDVGKTVVAGAICAQLNLPYWKPIQTGTDDTSDSDWMQRAQVATRIYPTRYSYAPPVSPHLAAKRVGQTIDLGTILENAPKERSVIEGAGGIMVPLNDRATMLDLMLGLDCQVVVVSRHYLGSLNHTLMTLRLLQLSGVELKGLIFSGPYDEESESILSKHSGVPLLGHVGPLAKFDRDSLTSCRLELA